MSNDSNEILSQDLMDRVAELEASLEETLPNYKVHLRDIHKMLMENPVQATLLPESAIATIVSGLSSLRGEALIPAKKAAISPKKLSLDDF